MNLCRFEKHKYFVIGVHLRVRADGLKHYSNSKIDYAAGFHCLQHAVPNASTVTPQEGRTSTNPTAYSGPLATLNAGIHTVQEAKSKIHGNTCWQKQVLSLLVCKNSI